MRFELIGLVCARCGLSYSVPEIGPASYGEFLLRASDREVAYLDAVADPTFEEVDRILSFHPKITGMQPHERASVLRRVYGAVACDPSSSGAQFDLSVRPSCPRCGSRDASYWSFFDPPRFADLHVSPVTHENWFSLTPAEKAALVDREISSLTGQ